MDWIWVIWPENCWRLYSVNETKDKPASPSIYYLKLKQESTKSRKRSKIFVSSSEFWRIMDIACPTCLNPFSMYCDISATHCGHLFHTNCVTKWLQTGKKSCPSCRENCTLKKLIKLYLLSTGNVKKRDAIQADLDRAESETKRLKSEMAEKDEVYKSMHEWIFWIWIWIVRFK